MGSAKLPRSTHRAFLSLGEAASWRTLPKSVMHVAEVGGRNIRHWDDGMRNALGFKSHDWYGAYAELRFGATTRRKRPHRAVESRKLMCPSSTELASDCTASECAA